MVNQVGPFVSPCTSSPFPHKKVGFHQIISPHSRTSRTHSAGQLYALVSHSGTELDSESISAFRPQACSSQPSRRQCCLETQPCGRGKVCEEAQTSGHVKQGCIQLSMNTSRFTRSAPSCSLISLHFIYKKNESARNI